MLSLASLQRAPKPDTKRHSFGVSSSGSSFLPAFCLQSCFSSLPGQNHFSPTPRTCCLLQAPELSTFSLHSPVFGCTEVFRQILLLREVLTPLCGFRWVTLFPSALAPTWDPSRAFWGCPRRRYGLSDLSSTRTRLVPWGWDAAGLAEMLPSGLLAGRGDAPCGMLFSKQHLKMLLKHGLTHQAYGDALCR